jgi:hypothetical protein
VTLPLLLVAVRVYVVVTVGETVFEVPVTVPTPLSKLNVVALVVDQESVVEPPELIVAGLAVKEDMVGGTALGNAGAIATIGVKC